MPKEVEIVVETITLSTDEFLAFLPTAQQEIVKAYAKEHGVTPLEAFNELMYQETKENIADRSH